MSKGNIIIGAGGVLFSSGILVGLRIISRFLRLLGSDSVGPKAIEIISSFNAVDYIQILFCILLIIAGMLLFLRGIYLHLKNRSQNYKVAS